MIVKHNTNGAAPADTIFVFAVRNPWKLTNYKTVC